MSNGSRVRRRLRELASHTTMESRRGTLAAYDCVISTPGRRFSISLETPLPIAHEKSCVVTVIGLDSQGQVVSVAPGSWPPSESLASPYVYLGGSVPETWTRLRELTFVSEVTELRLQVRRWRLDHDVPTRALGLCLVESRDSRWASDSIVVPNSEAGVVDGTA